MSLPPYVSDLGHGEIVCEAPVLIRAAMVHGFPLLVDRERLGRFVASQLQPPGCPVRYEAPLPLVLLACLDSPDVAPENQVVGYQTDRECAFLVPLRQIVTDAHGHPHKTWRIWAPYLFIDNMLAMATGREIWGFRKSPATIAIDVPDDSAQPASLMVKTQTFKHFATTTPGRWAPILELRGEPPHAHLPAALGGLAGLIGAILHAAAGALGAAEALLLNSLAGQLSGEAAAAAINLKQIRVAADSTRACYQALVETPLRVDRLDGIHLLFGRRWTLEVLDCASHRIVDDLGLHGTRNGAGNWRVDPLAGFRFQLSFRTEAGNILWEAPR